MEKPSFCPAPAVKNNGTQLKYHIELSISIDAENLYIDIFILWFIISHERATSPRPTIMNVNIEKSDIGMTRIEN